MKARDWANSPSSNGAGTPVVLHIEKAEGFERLAG